MNIYIYLFVFLGYFSFGHCIVCSSSMYRFWLPHFGIFKLLLLLFMSQSVVLILFSFKEICEHAYLIIRQKAPLLIQLFIMMLSSGIPQLNSMSDIDYLKEVLALNSTPEEAVEKFRKKFKEAKDNSWSTTVNWWFHMKAHWNNENVKQKRLNDLGLTQHKHSSMQTLRVFFVCFV